MISLNNPKYKMSVEDMKMIVGGKRVLVGTYYILKPCENGEEDCMEVDYTIRKYEIVDCRGISKNKWIERRDD